MKNLSKLLMIPLTAFLLVGCTGGDGITGADLPNLSNQQDNWSVLTSEITTTSSDSEATISSVATYYSNNIIKITASVSESSLTIPVTMWVFNQSGISYMTIDMLGMKVGKVSQDDPVGALPQLMKLSANEEIKGIWTQMQAVGSDEANPNHQDVFLRDLGDDKYYYEYSIVDETTRTIETNELQLVDFRVSTRKATQKVYSENELLSETVMNLTYDLTAPSAYNGILPDPSLYSELSADNIPELPF